MEQVGDFAHGHGTGANLTFTLKQQVHQEIKSWYRPKPYFLVVGPTL